MSVKSTALDATYAYFQRSDRRPPGRWTASAALGTPEADSRTANIQRRLAELTLPVAPLGTHGQTPIEALFVVAPKDFGILPVSIDGVLANSGHPVSRTVIITTRDGMTGAQEIADRVASSTTAIALEVLCEDDVISEEQRARLRLAFPDRYGWILQQLLCVAHVSRSQSPAVLLMDADTVLLRQRALIQGTRQLLMPSLEHHAPYYAFLREHGHPFTQMHHTFVSHHMVQQPELLRSMLDATVGGFDGLVETILRTADVSKESSICVDFEFYAQALSALHPDDVVLAKWSNAAAARPSDASILRLSDIVERFGNYFSVSFHSYVQ